MPFATQRNGARDAGKGQTIPICAREKSPHEWKSSAKGTAGAGWPNADCTRERKSTQGAGTKVLKNSAPLRVSILPRIRRLDPAAPLENFIGGMPWAMLLAVILTPGADQESSRGHNRPPVELAGMSAD